MTAFVALASAILTLLLAVAPARAADFYQYPSAGVIANAHDGQILASEPMTVSEPLQRVSSRATRIMYRSQGVGGQPVAVTGFILIPRGHVPSRGWPLIAWAHGTTGIGPNCAPSRWPILHPPGDHYPERLVGGLLSEGFAVVGTDYVGLGFSDMVHAYLHTGPEGRAVVDSVIAARHLAPQLGRRWFVIGHSQGGGAALATGEIATLRAPGLQFLGTVPIAPASGGHLIWSGVAGLRPPFSGLDFYLAAYALYITASAKLFAPSLQYTDLLSPQLAAEMPAARELCLADLAGHLEKLQPPLESIVNPNWASSAEFQRFIVQLQPSKRPSAGPILLLQGDVDPQVPIQATNQLFHELCRLGDVVEYRTYPTADHDTVITQAFSGMIQWLKDRLRGVPATQGCPAAVTRPRPAPPPPRPAPPQFTG